MPKVAAASTLTIINELANDFSRRTEVASESDAAYTVYLVVRGRTGTYLLERNLTEHLQCKLRNLTEQVLERVRSSNARRESTTGRRGIILERGYDDGG